MQASSVLPIQLATRSPGCQPAREQGARRAPDRSSSSAIAHASPVADQRRRVRLAAQGEMVERKRRRIGAVMPVRLAHTRERGAKLAAARLCLGAREATKGGKWRDSEGTNVEATLRALLAEVLGLDAARVADVRSSRRDLFGALPEFDSMAVAALLTGIEERFAILIEDDDAEAEDFMTFGRCWPSSGARRSPRLTRPPGAPHTPRRRGISRHPARPCSRFRRR